MKKGIFYVFVFCILSGSIYAQSLLLQEDFNLTAGTNISGQNSWTTGSSGGSRLYIASSGLTYSGYAGSGVGNALDMPTVTANGDRIHHTFSGTFTGYWYLSFMVKVDTAFAGDYFIGYFYNNAFRSRVYIKTATGGFQFGAVKTSTGTPAYTSTIYPLHSTYLVVLKYAFNTATTTNDTVFLFVNPTPGNSEPAPTLGPLTDAGSDVASATLAVQSRPAAGSMVLDGIRLGTTWEAVLPPPPYYYRGSGALTDVLNWGSESDGSGSHPPNFTTADQSFYVKNIDSVVLSESWTVSGTNSKVVVVSGTKLVIGSGGNLAGTVDVSSGAILYLTTNNFPTFGSNSGTVAFYNASGFTLSSPVTLPTGSGVYEIISGNIDVGTNTFTVNGTLDCGSNMIYGNGTFTLASGASMRISHAEGITVASAAGPIQTTTRSYNTGANYTYKGSGTNLVTGDGLPGTITAININLVDSSSIVTLSSALVTTGNVNLTKGRLRLGDNNLTVGNPSGGGTSSYIITNGTGSVIRSITTSSTSVKTYHIGSESEYRKALITFPSTSGLGSASNLAVRYVAWNGGSAGYPTGINTHYHNGYWIATMDQAPVNAYTFEIETAGMSGISDYHSMRGLKRADSTSAWSLAGTSSTTSGTVVTETGCNGFSQFALGGLLPAYINITAIPEGYYDEGTNSLRMRDTFWLCVANTVSPYAAVDSAKIILDSLTFTGGMKSYTIADGNYYLMLKGRAVIETLSKTGGEIVTKGTTLNYNFTTSQSQAYGDNMIIHGSKWCIYTGDVNQDGFVDFSDLGLIDNDSYNYVAGYVVTDLNGDQFVDFTDLGMCDNNSYNYIGTVKPPAKANTKPLTRNNLKWISN